MVYLQFVALLTELIVPSRHNELSEDDILNVETCRSILFVIIVFDIIV